MNQAFEPKDLIVLVADKDMEETIRGLLGRTQSLKIRSILYEIYRHPAHDAGCRSQSHEFLRSFHKQFRHALVLFDKDGCGIENEETEQIEQAIEEKLRINGWDNRANVLVIEPELEIWIWGDSREVDQVCGWSGQETELRKWLVEKRYLQQENAKPDDPKGAFLAALRQVRKPASASLFRKLAENVSFRACSDRAFVKLKDTLREWFPNN